MKQQLWGSSIIRTLCVWRELSPKVSKSVCVRESPGMRAETGIVLTPFLESLLSERLLWEKTGIVMSENEEGRRGMDFQQSPEAVLGEIF